jgi:parvulin-like peptidyl-prolyl isomerase
VRGAVILLEVPAKATAEKQAEFRQRAEASLKEALAAANEHAFSSLVMRSSEDQATRYRGGDIGWVSRDNAMVEAPLREALFALKKPGEFAPLVRTPRGFYVAKLLGRREATRKPLAEVQEAIRHQLSRQKAEKAERDFYSSAKAGLDIHVNHALLESISLPTETNEPPRLPGTQTAQLSNGGHHEE